MNELSRPRVAICPCGCRWFGVWTEPPPESFVDYPTDGLVDFYETLQEAVAAAYRVGEGENK